MALPTENQWTDPRERHSFQKIFADLPDQFVCMISDADVEQNLNNPMDLLHDEDHGTRGFPEDRRGPTGPNAPKTFMETAMAKQARIRQHTHRYTRRMKRVQIRRAMRRELEEQKQRSCEQVQLNMKPRHIGPESQVGNRAPEPFDKLPVEMLVQIIGHTHIDTIPKLERSLTRLGDVLNANPKACYDAILRTQYPHWMEALGGVGKRSKRQKTNLFRAMASLPHGAWVINAWPKGLTADGLIMDTYTRANWDTYCPREYLILLNHLESRFAHNIGHLTASADCQISKAAAVCLEQWSHPQFRVVNGSLHQLQRTQHLTWHRRLELFEEQDDQVKLEIGSILGLAVRTVVKRGGFFGPLEIDDILEAYELERDTIKPRTYLLHVATYATAIVLDAIFNIPGGMVLATPYELPGLSPIESWTFQEAAMRAEYRWRLSFRGFAADPQRWPKFCKLQIGKLVHAVGFDVMGFFVNSGSIQK